MTRPHPLIASDRIEGTAVRRPNGDRLGHIERLMIDKLTGKVSYAILSFGGSSAWEPTCRCLGPPSYSTRFEAYVLDIDDEELRRAPSFRADKDFDWGDRSQEARTASLLRNTALLGRFLSRVVLLFFRVAVSQEQILK